MPEITITNNSAAWALKLDPKYRYIFIKGGRSSGKSHEVAQYLCERSISEKDIGIVCLREVQKSIKRSSKQLINQKLIDMGIDDYYKSIETEIRKKNDKDQGLFIFQGMNDLTADNVKSLEGFKIAWFEEAQNASFKTLKTLRPTIRAEGSQLIFTWNPKIPTDPIDEFCAAIQNEPDVLVIHVNYTDNPFLSDTMNREIELEKSNTTDDEFEHIYLGGYDTSFQGHYYAKLVQQARDDGRVCEAPKKAGIDIISAWDLGMRDSTAIWVAQCVGLQWRIIDYYENSFEELDHYVQWMKDNGYDKGHVYLPHDGAHERLGMMGSIKSQVKSMGLNNVTTLANNSIDSGMALAKNLLKECYFDKERCREGLAALSHYHSKFDEVKKIYKEVHDWSSHGSDAFRYLAQAIDNNDRKITPKTKMDYGYSSNNTWMG